MCEAAPYPIELEADVTLANHRRLHVRPLLPYEVDPIRDLDSRLSLRTRYHRFLSPMPQLSSSLLNLLACVDYRRRLAVVAEEDDGEGRKKVVALGNLGGAEDGTAELAIVVQDDWQKQGLGSAIVAGLLRAAEERGFHRFVIHALSDNVAIWRLLARFGRVVASRTTLGVSEVTFVPSVRATKA